MVKKKLIILMRKNITKQKNKINVLDLLYIGTFLECFDFMLVNHLSAIANETFLPPNLDPLVQKLLRTIGFSIGYILRPISSITFRYVETVMSKRSISLLIACLMSCGYLTMAILPTYQSIGYLAILGLIVSRIIHAISSVVGKNGAELYIAETIEKPCCFRKIGFINLSSAIGNFSSISLGAFMMCNERYYGINHLGFRITLAIGALTAFIGIAARNTLKEAPKFLDARKALAKKANISHPVLKSKTKKTTLLAIFFYRMPISGIMTFIYIPEVLRENFGYTSKDVLLHNFKITFLGVACSFVIACLSSKYNPIKITKFTLCIFFLAVFTMPLLLTSKSIHTVTVSQALFTIASSHSAVQTIFLKKLPIFQRFTSYVTLFSLSSSLLSTIGVGWIFLKQRYDHIGMACVLFILGIAVYSAIKHFESITKAENIIVEAKAI